MHALVIGSGFIGTAIASYLARAGHQVGVVVRQPGPALETNYANAGEVSAGYSAPWAGPGVPLKSIKWMLMHHSPLVIKPMRDPAMWRWGMSRLRKCAEARYPNLYLSTGHEAQGRTIATSTGRVTADLVSGRSPEISIHDLGVARYA